MIENKLHSGSEIKNTELILSVGQKFSLSSVEIDKVQSNLLVVNGIDGEGETSKIVLKKSRNSGSPLLCNRDDREKIFYGSAPSDSDLNHPTYLGNIDGYMAMSFLEQDAEEVRPEMIVDAIKELQMLDPDHFDVAQLTGEYIDKKTVLSFIRDIINQMQELGVHEYLAKRISESEKVIGDALDYLNQMPQVLVHGDCWRNNALHSSDRLFLLDWENFQINNNYYDVATLLHTEKLMFSNNEFKPESHGYNDSTALDFNFLLQTISQILPELLKKDHKSPKWERQQLELVMGVFDKYK